MSRAKAVESLKQTFAILEGDIKEVRKISSKEMSDFHHRTSIRTYSALIEGLLYQMRQVAIRSEQEGYQVYKHEEKMILGEKSFSLDDKGEIKEKDYFQRPLPMLLFTLKQYPKVHGAEFIPDTSVHGWECIKKLIRIRDRIVHPKSEEDLKLTQEEWREVNIGIDWFESTVTEMLAECDRADEHYSKKSV